MYSVHPLSWACEKLKKTAEYIEEYGTIDMSFQMSQKLDLSGKNNKTFSNNVSSCLRWHNLCSGTGVVS